MRSYRFPLLILGGGIILLISKVPLKPYLKAFSNNNPPQLILVLGGDIDREHVGAKMAKALKLPLILSGGSNPEHAKWLLKQAGIPSNQVELDYRAKDTLTNFTSLVDDLAAKKIDHAFIITSQDHLPRAITVGNVIAGSRGIKLTGISVSCTPNCKKESIQKQAFDLIRAITWVSTGKDLKQLSEKQWSNNLNRN